MKEKELGEQLDLISSNMSIFTDLMDADYNDGDYKYYITKEQSEIVQSMFDLFKGLNWQIALNSYKEIVFSDKEAIRSGLRKTGQAVKVRPCNEKYEGKTYFGILIGDVALNVSCSIDKEENLNIGFGHHNPAILIPELGEIVYGCGSWWGVIKSDEDLKEVITEDTIKNVWYMKLLENPSDSKPDIKKDNVRKLFFKEYQDKQGEVFCVITPEDMLKESHGACKSDIIEEPPVFEPVYMTDEEFNNLPEFEGY